MNERLLQYLNNAKKYWNKFNRRYKLLIIGTIVVSLLTIGLVIVNNSKTEYAQAFRDLQPNDAAAIKQYLDGAKIPYKLSSDGTVIEVPKSQVADVKLNVVSQGLLKNGSIGYEIFQKSNILGTTDNQFQMMKLDAIQGELQRLINSNVAISSSKVLITMPQQSAFSRPDNKEQATASVVVQTKLGYALDQQKIDTMYQLISKSVPNLPVDNITISDQNGDLLPYSKTSAGSATSGVVSQQFQIKRDFEQNLRKEIKDMLGGILGPNKVIPMVVATLNFDKKSRNSNLVTPVVGDNGVVISSQESAKTSTNSGGTGGVPGTGTTDIPTYPAGNNSGGSNSDESSKTFNYEVNHINEIIESQPFYVTDLTVSIGLDAGANIPQATKDAIERMLNSIVQTSLANSGKTLTPAELAAKVTVFDQPFAAGTTAAGASRTNWYLYGGIGALAAVLAAAGGFAVASRRRKAKLAALEAEMAPASAKVEFPTIDLDNMTNENQARKQLEQLAKKKPEEFVNLLRTWLVDE